MSLCLFLSSTTRQSTSIIRVSFLGYGVEAGDDGVPIHFDILASKDSGAPECWLGKGTVGSSLTL